MKKISSFPHSLLCAALALLMAACPLLHVGAQSRQASSFDDTYIFWGYPETYLSYQTKIACPLIDRMLQAYPPVTEPDLHRRMALVTLDQFLHDPSCTKRDGLYAFFNSRMAHMLEDMQQPVLSGVCIYKLYNSGFIIRTLKSTIAIDIVPGGESAYKPLLTDSVLYEIAGRCDALLITNADKRHANRKVAQAFADAGKKVLLPKGLWNSKEEAYITLGADTAQTLTLNADTVHILPGHNGNTRNNIYIINFPGRGIVAHTGAQDSETDLAWIAQLHDKYNIDILLTQSSNLNLGDMLKGFMPRLVITAHENDLERSIDRRDSYWAAQKRLDGLDATSIPSVIMTWGEAYRYADTESDNISKSANKVMINGVLYIERKGAVYTPSGVKVK